MRLLVTRPEPDASDLAARLAALGHTVFVQPMMHIEFADPPLLPRTPAAIVATSRNGVRALSRWPSADAWRSLPVFTVGRATAKDAREAGFQDVRVGNGDVAALASAMRAQAVSGPILYPAARDRSADLAALLAPAEVVTVEAYRGVAAEALDRAVATAIADGGVDGVLFYSHRTATIFVDLVAATGIAEGLRQTTLFALSSAVAEPLAALGARKIAVAETADEDALLALVSRGP